MKKLLTLAFLLISFCAFSQSFKSKYKDLLEPNSKLVASGFNYTLEKIDKQHYIKKKYFPENRQITHFISYNSKKLDVKHGTYAEYFDDGELIKKGDYDSNQKTGKWYESGFKGNYVDGKREGEWLDYHSNDKVAARYNYKAGKLDGKKIVYDSLGNLHYEEIYDKGELISSTNENKAEINKIEEMPRFPGCENLEGTVAEKNKCAQRKMLEYVYRNINYPKKARRQDVQGSALISFVIEKDGSISNIKPLRGITKEIREECIKLIKSMPKWRPGMKNGEPVKVNFNLPIKFRLR